MASKQSLLALAMPLALEKLSHLLGDELGELETMNEVLNIILAVEIKQAMQVRLVVLAEHIEEYLIVGWPRLLDAADGMLA
eukprot:3064190-Rhodomonas_salina.5